MSFFRDAQPQSDLETLGKDVDYTHNCKKLLHSLENSRSINPKLEENYNEVYKEAYVAIEQVMKTFTKGNSPDIASVKKIVVEIVNKVMYDRNVYLYLSTIKDVDRYTFLHSVDVCVLCIVIGKNLGLGKSELTTLGLGAILHDVGKCKIPSQILLKPGRLTEKEFYIMKQHTVIGYEMLINTDNIEKDVTLIALQHHEKMDGSGYPNNLNGNDINKYARICTIADVYNAIISTRIYKKQELPHKASKFLLNNSSNFFDPEVLKTFAKSINTYSKDWIILLSTGEVGRIIDEETFGLPKRIKVFAHKKEHKKLILIKSYIKHLFNDADIAKILVTNKKN